MAFSLKTWVNRISEYPNRRKLTHEDGSTELVTVARAEGQISAEGNAFSAEEMNDLENRIKGGFDEVNQSLTQLNEGSKLKLLGNANGKASIDISRYIDDYSELLISVTLGNTPYRITINIPPAELVYSDITYQSGSRASASIGTVVNVQCSRKRVLLTAVIVNDNDVLAYSTLRIYGRK